MAFELEWHVGRQYCNLSVSGCRLRRFLQFRLGSHGLPVAMSRFSGSGHLDRAARVCTYCGGHAVGDEMHMILNVPPLIARYANLFTPETDTMRRFFARQDRLRVFQFVLDCLDCLVGLAYTCDILSVWYTDSLLCQSPTHNQSDKYISFLLSKIRICKRYDAERYVHLAMVWQAATPDHTCQPMS